MNLKSMTLSQITTKLLVAGLIAFAPHFAYADRGSGHGGGSDDLNPEPSHSETPHSSPTPNPSATIDSGSNEKTQVTDPTTGATFKFERKQKSKRGVVIEDKFTGSLKLTVPTLSVGVSSNDDATAADVVLTLSRANAAYAECSLDFDSLKRTRAGYKAEYKVSIEEKLKKGVLTSKVKKGSCDIDLATDGIQSDLPNLQNGDSFIIEINGVSVISGSL